MDLFKLGDLSVLGSKINPVGPTHSFKDIDKDVCIPYKRDCNESNTNAKENTSLDTLVTLFFSDYGVDYVYFFNDKEWYLYDSNLRPTCLIDLLDSSG